MRVAVISARFPCGHHEPYLAAELAAVRSRVEHLAVAPLRPGRNAAQDAGGARVILQYPYSGKSIALAFATLRRAPRETLALLAALLRARSRPLVKMKNLAVFSRSLALAEVFRRDRIDHVHAYWLSTPATAAWIVARINGIPWSATAHRWDIFEDNLIAEKARSASFVRAISERGRWELAKRAPEFAEKFVVVRLGTAISEASASRRNSASLQLLCAAAFVPTKGHADLLEAFAQAHARNAALRLTLCGEGPLEAEMRARAAALPCSEAIVFRGYVEHLQLLREMTDGRYDAVVLASRDDGVREMEGVPSILIEAASLGIACVSTRSGAIGELLDDESGFLAQPGEPQNLARAIVDACDAPERERRAGRGCERARRLHDPARSAGEFAALIGVAS